MAESNINLPIQMEVSFSETDLFDTLIELLSKYEKELPKDLINALHEMADSDKFLLTVEDAFAFAGSRQLSVEHSLGGGFDIGAINKILRKVQVFHDGRMHWIELESFWCKLNGEMYVQWGEE